MSEFDVLAALKGIRLFENVAAPSLAAVCQQIESGPRSLANGEYLFQQGDPDGHIYIVKSGVMELSVRQENGEEMRLKLVRAGGSMFSSLSIVDLLTLKSGYANTVSAKAIGRSTILILTSRLLETLLPRHSKLWLSGIRLSLTRLQRVSLRTLRDLRVPGTSATFAQHVDLADDPTWRLKYCLNQAERLNMKEDLKLKHDALVATFSSKLTKYSAGEVIIDQGSRDVVVAYVVTGCLEVLQNVAVAEEKQEELVCFVHARDVIGGLAVVTGDVSLHTVRARTNSRVVVLTKKEFRKVMRQNPEVVVPIVRSELGRLSPFVRSVDFALDWEMLEAGKALYHQGDEADSLRVVLSGRLRSAVNDDGKLCLDREYGRGDLIGLPEILFGCPTTSVIATRDAELAIVSRELLKFIWLAHPVVKEELLRSHGRHFAFVRDRLATRVEPLPDVHCASTIAVIAVSENVPLTAFTIELYLALKLYETVGHLSSERIVSELSETALESLNEYILFNYLSRQEDLNSVVVYQCDFDLSDWTKRCIRRADRILIVGNGASEPSLGPVEQQLEQLGVRAKKELVLLWKDDVASPSRTTDWLDIRGSVVSHHHVRCADHVFLNESFAQIRRRVFSQCTTNKFSDFSRLARMLTGNAMGVVLGGGGARGAAHIGVIKAMKELGMPIDVVAGVSMGAFIGAIFAETPDTLSITQRPRALFSRLASWWLTLRSIDVPAFVSLLKPRLLNTAVQLVIPEQKKIEDLWLSYFTITTDITSSEMRVHRTGPVCDYVTASMRLAHIMPPQRDPANGHLLVDGGYVNNLPADVMRRSGVRHVIAVDVGAQVAAEPSSMFEVYVALVCISSNRQLEELKRSNYCSYLRPPIDAFGLTQFARIDEISAIGYQHAAKVLAEWKMQGKFGSLLDDDYFDDVSRWFVCLDDDVTEIYEQNPMQTQL